jgi:hypothetical protein
MMVVFLFHNASFFDTGGWHVKSPRTSEALSFVTLIVTVQWMLPLFLVLRSRAGDHLVAALSGAMRIPGLIFLSAIPLAISSFIVIMALYELLIRRINLLRFLFGLKMRRPQPVPAPQPSPST